MVIESFIELLKSIVKKSLVLFNRNRLNKHYFNLEINKRMQLPFTEVEKLSANFNLFNYYSREIFPSNEFYSHASTFKRFLGLSYEYNFNLTIEHGVFFGNQISKLDVTNTTSNIITFSSRRIKYLKKYKKHIIPIGPYIHYASHLLTPNQINNERKRLGSCLLFFPTHSTPDLTTHHDVSEISKKLKILSKNFQTTRVCLYWKDVQTGIADKYRQEGFECVTAGHVYDPFFLSRLKSIIECSTYTASNDLGTHLGYCIYLKKPHLLIPQKLNYSGKKDEIKLVHDYHSFDNFQKLCKTFMKMNKYITLSQYKMVNYYWGFDQIKTKKQLTSIINKTDSIS